MLKKLKPKWWSAALLAVSFIAWPVITGTTANLNDNLPLLPWPGQAALTPEWGLVPSLDNLDLTSFSAVVVSLPDGHLVGAMEPDFPLSLASLTKVMTSVVTLESKTKLDSKVTLTAADNNLSIDPYVAAGDSVSKLNVNVGQQVAMNDLFAAALIGSANNAAAALARATGWSADEFVRRMNERAQVLGMTNTTVRGADRAVHG